MTVVRVNKTKDYTVMSNAHLRDTNMSLKAKGLLSLMLSLPDSWDYSIEGLCHICVEGETAVKSTLAELRMLGYVNVIKKLPSETKSGRIEYEYNIYETPFQTQAVEKQDLENLPLEILPLENQGQLNTKQPSTKQSNTEIIKDIVACLNSVCGTSYKHTTSSTQAHINKRLKEGFTFDDFVAVIAYKFKEWGNDTKMKAYLRPETLFGTKFESYLQNAKSNTTPTLDFGDFGTTV